MRVTERLKDEARFELRRAGLLTGGLLCCIAGLGFLTYALWMVLAAWQDAMFAAQVLGALYLGLGALCFAFASGGRRPPSEPEKAREQSDPIARVIDAFVTGMEAGREMRARR